MPLDRVVKDTPKPSGRLETGEEKEIALARGRLVHKLLEHLPIYQENDWIDIATKILSSDYDSSLIENLDLLVKDVINLLKNPKLTSLFNSDALTEVDISVNLPSLNGQRIHGSIDRLIFENNTIYCVDFKTNKLVPQTVDQIPDGLLRQMGAYLEALNIIYPDYTICPQILWTTTGYLMDLPCEILISALQNRSLT